MSPVVVEREKLSLADRLFARAGVPVGRGGGKPPLNWILPPEGPMTSGGDEPVDNPGTSGGGSTADSDLDKIYG